ncbi:MAG: S9 family peptidase [Acidobacteria bacterium]|nr:S9 family peptidase [Acidobacteriota bacterium]
MPTSPSTKLRPVLLLVTALALPSCQTVRDAPSSSGVPPHPATRIEIVKETLHGTVVEDPYRWIEGGGAEFDTWLDAQDRRARTVLAGLPNRNAIRDAIVAAGKGVTRVNVVRVTGSLPRIFLRKRAPEEETSRVYMRDGWNGADVLLVDPGLRNSKDVHHTVDYVAPSDDGRYLAYGISASGSEDSVIEVMEVDTRRVLPERIDRAQYAGVNWRKDGRSFFYWRRAKPKEGASRADWFKNSATYLHTLGDDPEKAAPVFGPQLAGLGVCEECFSGVQTSPASDWLLAWASPGTSADVEYFVAPAASASPGARIPWRRVSGPKDHIKGMVAHGDRLYALSYDGAPRFKVVSFDAKDGSLASAKDFVPASRTVLEEFAPARDGLYLRLLERGISRLARVPYAGGPAEDVPLPFAGALYNLSTEADRDGAIFTLTGWTTPMRSFAAGPDRTVRDLALTEKWPVDYTHIVAEEVEVKSQDGTLVPMSILRRRDTALDGRAPALLEGYAAYGASQSPYFAPTNLTWVDRGGVYAECHARGGGAYGEEWHLAGHKQNKERGIEDMVACATHLVSGKYTAATRLSVTGTSAGGILAGGTITRRPGLFAVALLRVPLLNLLRFEKTEGGPANVPEWGTVTDAPDFRAMLASDPFYRIVPGTRYPAVLVTAGKHDVRVPAWQPAKFVARLQKESAGGPVVFRVERDAGHGLGSKRSQVEEEWADLFAFALSQSAVE